MRVLLQVFATLMMVTSISSQEDYRDLNFGTDGTATINLPQGILGEAVYISLDSLENCYVLASVNDPVFIKLTPTGEIDNTFGDQGYFYREDYFTYQKDNYLISINLIEQSSAIDVYDLDLNLIHGFRLPSLVEISSITFTGTHLLGSTDNGEIFKIDVSGNLESTFGEGGLLKIDYPEFNNPRYFYSLNDSTHLVAGFNLGGLQTTQVLAINNSGELLNLHTIDSLAFGSFRTAINFDFAPLQSNEIIINYDLYNFDNQPSEITYYKLDSKGELDTLFGDSGVLSPEVPNDFNTNLLGELTSRHIPIHNLNASSNQELYLINPNGKLNTEFADDGYYSLSSIIGDGLSQIMKSSNDDFLYISSHFSFSPSLVFITKLDLSTIPLADDFSSDTQSVSDSDSKHSFSIFPNPTIDHVSFRYKGPTLHNVYLKITDSTGQVMQTAYLNKIVNHEEQNLPIADLASGPYFISIWQNNKSILSEQFYISNL